MPKGQGKSGTTLRKKNLADAKKAAEDWYEDAQKWISDKAAEIGDMVDDLFDRARKWIPRRDPLTLDLDGDGIETVAASGKVLFDHDGDGIKTGTGWIASDDGLVVLDRNGNGTIDGGSELFWGRYHFIKWGYCKFRVLSFSRLGY
ncbi:hypothetical protein [Xanthomonas arboricola]|uniref:hypothetical protein n=1 Tax=Xanthomonas arboricola TaxID=56448 RepID=UPI001F37A780|nr:hypothetical protein [Xanthomonas arboricola]UJO03548.1 hypothetical protein K9U01_17680 [Xanthomonas arboricola pv. pruni]